MFYLENIWSAKVGNPTHINTKFVCNIFRKSLFESFYELEFFLQLLSWIKNVLFLFKFFIYEFLLWFLVWLPTIKLCNYCTQENNLLTIIKFVYYNDLDIFLSHSNWKIHVIKNETVLLIILKFCCKKSMVLKFVVKHPWVYCVFNIYCFF